MDLTEALRAAQGGDEAAMTELFRALNPPLSRYLVRRAPAVAEDLASECWCAAAKVLAEFDGDGDDLRAWMFGVARRQVANYWRARGRGVDLVLTASLDDVPAPDVGDAVVDALSSQDAIDALVRDLPEYQAEVVLLRVIAGLSVDQVATLLGRRPGAIRVAQHRALRHLAARTPRKPVTR